MRRHLHPRRVDTASEIQSPMPHSKPIYITRMARSSAVSFSAMSFIGWGGDASKTLTGTGPLTLKCSGTGKIYPTLNGSGYSGPVTIAPNTYVAPAFNALPLGSGAVTMQNGTTIDLSVFNSSLTVSDLSDAGATSTAVKLGGNTLTVNSVFGTTFGGVISGTNGKLTKIGTGILTLNGGNIYTGQTTVSDGTLLVMGSLAAASAVAVNSGTTLGGSGSIGGGGEGFELLADARDVRRQQGQVFANALAKGLDFPRVGPQVGQGELLGRVLELQLNIGADDGETKQGRDGVGKMGDPFLGQITPRGVTRGKGADFVGMRGDIDVVERQGSDKLPELVDGVCNIRRLGATGEDLKLLQTQPEQTGRERLRYRASASILVYLEIIEIVPVIDDQEVGLLFAALGIGPGAGAATEHLPELHLAEDRLGEDEIAQGRHVDAGVEHVHGNGDPREVLVLEIVEAFLGPLHLAVNHLGKSTPLQVRIETIEALVEFEGVPVRKMGSGSKF